MLETSWPLVTQKRYLASNAAHFAQPFLESRTLYAGCVSVSEQADFPSYQELLERAYKLLPKRRPKTLTERFTLPRFEATVAGKKTYIVNFKSVADLLNREPHTLLRYLLKETALPGYYEEGVAVIQGEVSSQLLNKLLERFFNEYVKCPICESPDTLLVKEKRLMQIKCMACGAVSPVKPF